MTATLSRLKIALVADELTQICLAHECRLASVTPWNYRAIFKYWQPDLLLVESAWRGRWNSWKYKIAAYPDHPQRNNVALRKMVTAAREAGIPCLFWCREDGVHFSRFIDSARLFDAVFTVDADSIPRYQNELGTKIPVEPLLFAAQPKIHFPLEITPARRASFIGSYHKTAHPRRRVWQEMIFDASQPLGLTIYDRNSARKAPDYRYPSRPWITINKAVPHTKTADIYRRHIANINVNTVEVSRTAFSRRLVEIMACGGLVITNPTPAIDALFADYCLTARTGEEAREIFARLSRDGLSMQDRQRLRAGTDYIHRHHTWNHRLQQIVAMRERLHAA